MISDTFKCNMLSVGMMGLGHVYCYDCELFSKANVCQSGAGFYIGVYDEGVPFCRITGYSETKEKAEKVLNAIRGVK